MSRSIHAKSRLLPAVAATRGRATVFGQWVAVGWLLGAVSAHADIFLLKNDGQVRGELVNKDESPRATYQVRTPAGGVVTLEAADVAQQVHQSALEMEYDRMRVTAGDTIDEQWKLAEWCREKHLVKQRRPHLERILELDPDHGPARRALNYSHIGGKWVTQAQKMADDGYVETKDGWRLPQEVELNRNDTKRQLAEKDWFRKLKMYRNWLDTPNKAADARAEIVGIDDPFATPALAKGFSNDPDRNVRRLYIDALAQIGTPTALNTLTAAMLFDLDEEVRMACLEQIVRKGYKPAVGACIAGLKNNDNAVVNRAGVALGQLRDPSSIEPLIHAVITTHKFDVPKGGGPGQMNTMFGAGPGNSIGGFTFGGGGTERVVKQIPNPSVLTALVGLTNVNFEYNTEAWRYWFASQKKPTTMDVRRD